MLHADSPRGEHEDASSQSNSSSSDSDSSGGDGEREREAGECMAASLSVGEPIGVAIISDSIISDSGEGAVKNWTYEDQFKQVRKSRIYFCADISHFIMPDALLNLCIIL